MPMQLKVISVNVGQAAPLKVGKKTTTTGILKKAVAGNVQVTAEGLQGDHVLNKKHHGGPDQAVYLYTAPDYDFWAKQLGEALEPGQFGENLVISGLYSADMRVGDRLDIGGENGVTLEVTAPRIPCATLAAHLNDQGFVKRFAAARRPGVYLRVLRPGGVKAGDTVTYQPGSPDAPTIAALFDLWYDDRPSREQLQAYLDYPVAQRLRKNLVEWLADLDAEAN